MSAHTRFKPETLERFATDLLVRLNLPDADAALTARALAQADLDGVETHGLGRLPNYVARLQKGLVNPQPHMTFVRQVGATALLDADNGMGQVAAARAMEAAIRLAEQFGTGWVAVCNSNHFGTASFYCDMAVAAGMIGFALSNTPPGMAPYGGREALLGTNPIGIGIPAGEATPISVDMATSAGARGQVLKAGREGKPIPPGWAIDRTGAPTTDPNAALVGALLPMGGAKGYGLALAVEALCGVLAGAAVGREIPSFFDDWERPSNVGHLLGAINVAAFADLAEFGRRIDQLIDEIRRVPPAVGHEAVLIPGERRARSAAQRRSSGVPLAAAAVEQLASIAHALGLSPLEADAPE
jgi:LDH2 family malate/lactate/ureidoglycolate dehydrogenase